MNSLRHAIDRATLWSLCALAVLLPFEIRTPIVDLGVVAITNVEIVLYLTILLGAIRGLTDARGLGPMTPLHWAVIVWIGVAGLSALMAPVERATAIRFALRAAGGVLLCFVGATTVRTMDRVVCVMTALAAGATASALAGLVEGFFPAVGAWLGAFREQRTFVGGVPRASGTFDYANTAAMYWEAVLPLAIAAGASLSLRRPLRLLPAAAPLLIVPALALTLSRAGLLIGFGTLVGLLALGGRMPRIRWGVAGGLTALLLLATFAPTAVSVAALRLGSDRLQDWYKPEFTIDPGGATMEGGATTSFAVTVANQGLRAWPATGPGVVALTYYWEDSTASGRLLASGDRVLLPAQVEPGQQVTIAASVRAPGSPGQYTLRWDLVAERLVWASTLGAATGTVPVTVTPPAGPLAQTGREFETIAPLDRRIGRLELWRAAWRIWLTHPWLGAGPGTFTRLHAAYVEPSQYDSRNHANSLYLEALSTMGVAGVAALIGLIGASVVQIRRGWRSAASADGRVIVLALGLGLGAFFVHGLVDYFLIFTPTYGLFWLLVGMTSGLPPRGLTS